MKSILSSAGIDAAIGQAEAFMSGLGMERKSAVRMRLSLEETLLKFRDRLGEEPLFDCICGQKYRRSFITLSVPGAPFDPLEDGDSEDAILRKLLASSGLAPVYSYQAGVNRVTFYPAKKKRSPAIRMFFAIVAAMAIGFLGKLLPGETLAFVTSRVLNPLFGTFMGMLSAIAGPLIFLSVTWGIYSIGDTMTLGRIGKKMIGRFFSFTFLLLGLTAVCVLPLFPITLAKSQIDATGFLSIYEMILDIVPDNILLPLVEGNPLQIIFLAVVVGFSMLILSKKATAAAQLVEQFNYIVQLIMEFISTLVPVSIFVSLTQTMLSDQLAVVLQSYKLVLIVLGANLLLLSVCTAMVCIRQKLPPLPYLKKLLPTFLIAITTASSSAAFATNVECCRKDLGVNQKIVNFGIPLGQVVYMPGVAVLFFAASLCMAEVYAVAITPTWIITAFFHIRHAGLRRSAHTRRHFDLLHHPLSTAGHTRPSGIHRHIAQSCAGVSGYGIQPVLPAKRDGAARRSTGYARQARIAQIRVRNGGSRYEEKGTMPDSAGAAALYADKRRRFCRGCFRNANDCRTERQKHRCFDRQRI